jgi:hypothetical protein
MSFDDFPSYPLCASDEILVSFEDDFFSDQNPNAEPFFGDVTEATTTFCPLTLTIPPSPLFPFQNSSESPSPSSQPMSSSDSEWDGSSKVAKSKGKAGNRKPHRNQIKKGEGRDAKKDFWDFYDYQHGFFYGELRKIEENSLSAKLVFEICKVLRQKDRTDKEPLETANRWAKRRMRNAYAWLDRHREKISKEEFLDCVKVAKYRLNH